jgi:hypothetical protein
MSGCGPGTRATYCRDLLSGAFEAHPPLGTTPAYRGWGGGYRISPGRICRPIFWNSQNLIGWRSASQVYQWQCLAPCLLPSSVLRGRSPLLIRAAYLSNKAVIFPGVPRHSNGQGGNGFVCNPRTLLALSDPMAGSRDLGRYCPSYCPRLEAPRAVLAL